MTERNTDFRLMENHLYACIYDVLRSGIPDDEKLPTFQRYKVKLVRLHAKRIERIKLDNKDHDKMEGEQPTLFHFLK
jgi:hypothetical protein